jgi:endopeptidase La
MEDYQTPDRNFMRQMTRGILKRLRLSYHQGLVSKEIYQRGMKETNYLRNNFDTLSNEELENKLKEIARNAGCWRLSDIFILFYGDTYFFEIPNTPEEIDFYDEAFSPLKFSVSKAQDSSSIPIVPAEIITLGKTSSLYQLAGSSLVFGTQDKTYLVQGHYVRDTTEYYIKNYKFLQEKKDNLLKRLKMQVDPKYSEEYIKYMTLKQFNTSLTEELIMEISQAFKDTQKLAKTKEPALRKMLKNADLVEKRRLITIMMMRDICPQAIKILQKQMSKKEFDELFINLHNDIQLKIQKYIDIESFKNIKEETSNEVASLMSLLTGGAHKQPRKRKRSKFEKKSLRERVLASKAPQAAKEKALEKVRTIEKSRDGDAKAEKYVNGFLKIPFGVYKDYQVFKQTSDVIHKTEQLRKRLKIKGKSVQFATEIASVLNQAKDLNPSDKSKSGREMSKIREELNLGKQMKKDYLAQTRKTLDQAVYGHPHAKDQIERLICQWMNGRQHGAVIGLQGPPGNGKTSMVKEGIANCLKDKKGKAHPFVFIPLGGLNGGSSIIGHSFTYVGSIWGKIAQGLMDAQCMNPVFLFDELDKVSHTERGQEIISILTHLTDSTQNQKFYDEYFQGIPLDLSKAIFVFTFNDPSRIDRILRDRIQIIKTKALKMTEKLVIAQDYLLPKIKNEMGLQKQDLIISNQDIKMLIEDYTMEAGVRKIKELLYEVVRDANRSSIVEDWVFPHRLSTEEIKKTVKRRHPIIRDVIHQEPKIGVMNGMYANSTGLGGISRIEIVKIQSDQHLKLKLTGSQGDVMKESMECALSIAWNQLSKEEQDNLSKQKFGLHIHMPSCAQPIDGPSAGGAVTLTILSVFQQKKIPNDLAMTGEIELQGNITAIGGLDEKLLGAKKAGVKRVFYPVENQKDVDQILEDKIVELDENFQIEPVSHINQVIEKIWPKSKNKNKI